MLKGAIFDFDGTLFDSMFIWNNAGEEYLRYLGIEPMENLQKTFKQMSLFQAATYVREKYQLTLTVKDIMDGVNKTVENHYLFTIQPKAGVKAFLEEMKKRDIKMCIATATERYQVEAALKRCGMDMYFTEIFTCSDVGHGKDEPVIFEKAIKHLQTTKEETFIFEDAIHALCTAKSNGFTTVAVYDSYENEQSKLREMSDFYLTDFEHTEEFWRFALS